MSKKPLSEARLAANRANALKSTGPRSIEGKQRSRDNSFKHALTGGTGLLPSDDRDSYELYIDNLVDSLHPGSPLEYEICRDVADAHWRLRRIRSVESKMLTLPAVPPVQEKAANFDPYGSPYREPIILHPDMIAVPSDEPPRRSREEDLHTAARVLLDCPGAISNVSLYEQRIHRTIKNSMEELRRLQAERAALVARDMKAAIDRYKERRMHNLPLDLGADGFVFSIDEVRAAMHAQTRENEVAAARGARFDLAEYQKMHPQKVA